MTDAHILLVDTEESQTLALQETLRAAGYAITHADDCHDAINLLMRETFDVVLTELHSPRIDGFQILRMAARLEAPPAVIVQSHSANVDTVVAAFRAGADDFLQRPVPPAEVEERIARVLEDREQHLQARAVNAPASVPVLQVGDIQIDYLRHVVSYNGRQLRVTPIEYALLCCLARSEGEVVEGTTIVQYTHGHRLSNSEAQLLLKTHVRNLRRKIDPRYLTNIRGIGYRLARP
jgi:DNA-binding response OmpR family regulator